MAVKCNITTLALTNLNSLVYGFSCADVTCQIAENYMEYLNCPVDHQPCKDVVCSGITDIVECNIDPVNVQVNDITTNSAIVTFTKPIHKYTVTLLRDNVSVLTLQNPVSPLNLTGLTSNITYVVRFTLHCPHGEDLITETPFTTKLSCVTLTDIVGVAEIE